MALLLKRSRNLLGHLSHLSKGCFTQPFYDNLSIVNALEEEKSLTVTFQFFIAQDFKNSMGSFHGGALAAILDLGCIIAVKTKARDGITPVTAHIDADFISVLPINSEIKMQSIVYKTGKFLSFASGFIYNDKGQIVAKTSVVLKNIKDPLEEAIKNARIAYKE